MAYVFMLKRGTFCKHNSPFPSSPKPSIKARPGAQSLI